MRLRIVRHLDALLKHYGRDVTFKRGGTLDIPVKALIAPLDPAQMHTYFDDAEVAMFTRPALIVTVSGSVSLQVNDTLLYEGRTYMVKKTTVRTLGNTAVARTLLMD
ncbi:MAG: hypothetical protein IT210_11720 [Armatimonadetes bacterium]|nr:hypothetical protein [Armatimonadota bacterium]